MNRHLNGFARARILQLAAVAATTLPALVAEAQTITLPAAVPPRFEADGGGTQLPFRSQNFNPSAISYADCEDNIQLQFPLELSGFTSGQYIQAWASVNGDCTQDSARGVNTTTQTCWPLSSPIAVNESTAAQTVIVYARDIVQYQNGNEIPYPTTTYVPVHYEWWCHGQPTDMGIPIVITFVAVSAGGEAISGSTPATYGESPNPPFITDLMAPAPPMSVSLGASDAGVMLGWNGTDPSTDTPYVDESSEVYGFAVFTDPGASEEAGAGSSSTCNAPSALLASLGAGAAQSDAGISTGIIDDDAGISAGISKGIIDDPTFTNLGVSSITPPPAFAGSALGAGATGFPLKHLTNGVDYHAAVAVVDEVGNIGPLSSESCAAATGETAFTDGGGADESGGASNGGGGCSVTAVGSSGTFGGAVFGCFLALSVVVRRRRVVS